MINFNEAEKILQKLPISYYLKRRLNVKLEHSSSTYIDIYNDSLYIGYNNLLDIDNPDEKDIRCLLYHEVSHAFLTPLKLDNSTIINIFEDERIETICKDFYIDVDFKSFVKKINGNQINPSTSIEFFYKIVRFNEGPQDFINETYRLINKYLILNRDSTKKLCDLYHYDVYNLYRKISAYWNSLQIKQNESDNIIKQNENNNQETNNQINQNGNNIKQNDFENNIENNIEKSIKENITKCLNKAITNINNQFNKLIDTQFQEEFNHILKVKSNMTKMNSSAVNSYSGIFDTKSVVRDDYKYFIQKNRIGNVKRFSKIKLNLFIDTSGSFSDNEYIVNKMLYNLLMLEKKSDDFEFDVISMDMTEKLLNKDNRFIKCSGCNLLDDKIFDIFKKVQNKSATNINIVLFDGYAFSGDFYNKDKNKSNFKAFNTTNTIIISDYHNKEIIEQYCTFAKKLFIRSDYAKNLINNVVQNLRKTLK